MYGLTQITLSSTLCSYLIFIFPILPGLFLPYIVHTFLNEMYHKPFNTYNNTYQLSPTFFLSNRPSSGFLKACSIFPKQLSTRHVYLDSLIQLALFELTTSAFQPQTYPLPQPVYQPKCCGRWMGYKESQRNENGRGSETKANSLY